MNEKKESKSVLELLETEKKSEYVPNSLISKYKIYFIISLLFFFIALVFTIYDINNYQILICSTTFSMILFFYIEFIKRKYLKGKIVEIIGTVECIEKRLPKGLSSITNGIQKEKREAGRYYRVYFNVSYDDFRSIKLCFDTKFNNVREGKIIRVFVNSNEKLFSIDGDDLIANYYNYEILSSNL